MVSYSLGFGIILSAATVGAVRGSEEGSVAGGRLNEFKVRARREQHVFNFMPSHHYRLANKIYL